MWCCHVLVEHPHSHSWIEYGDICEISIRALKLWRQASVTVTTAGGGGSVNSRSSRRPLRPESENVWRESVTEDRNEWLSHSMCDTWEPWSIHRPLPFCATLYCQGSALCSVSTGPKTQDQHNPSPLVQQTEPHRWKRIAHYYNWSNIKLIQHCIPLLLPF